MSFIDDFQAGLEALPSILQRKYALLRDLDKSVHGILKQNEQHCDKEIEEMKQRIKAGNVTPDSSLIKFSDEAVDEQKHAIRIADEKVGLAVQAYDLVDSHIQQLDQYLRKLDEEIRHEKESTNSTGAPAPVETNAKSGKSGEGGGRGGRKKSRLASTSAAAATATVATATPASTTTSTNPTGMELDIPVDPNEPTYCLCNQVSYGEMIACDNPSCKIEWFHYGCVGLKDSPKGNWYCPECVGARRRKGK